MFRKAITFLMVAMLCLSATACGGSVSSTSSAPRANVSRPQPKLADGRYPVQQASYNDANGEYSLFLLNASPSVFNTTDLQMARLTDSEVSAGEQSYLEIDSGRASLHLGEDFKIEYFHAVTENQTNPQTGQTETIIVRRESSFWTPFAGALAGQMVANMLFAPRYYIPPPYQAGGVLTGYGGYGNSYGQAVEQYQGRYNAPPAAVKNRSSLRTAGRIRSNRNSNANSRNQQRSTKRPTGSGFGGSNLKKSTGSSRNNSNRRSTGFGSGRRSPSGFGSRRSGGFRRR